MNSLKYLLSWNLYLNIKNAHVNIPHIQKSLWKNLNANFLKTFSKQEKHGRMISSCTINRNISNEDSKQDESVDFSQFSSLATNEDIEKQIKLILMEYEILKQSGEKIPSTILLKDMQELLQQNSERGRQRYFNYLFKKEMAKLSDIRKKERKRLEREQREVKLGPKNTFFLMIRKTSMLKFYNSRMADSILFESPLVIDMGYHEFMSKRELINCADQISLAYGSNKIHKEPFNLYFCNLTKYNPMEFYLQNAIPHLNKSNCLITKTELSYLDIFPKERIIYLTPNAPDVLQKFDHDCVYVIGGFVDKSQPKPISLAKAKREGVKIAKLPLDHYLYWGDGSKSLTINQVMDILLEIKSSNDWKKALKYVPTRKLRKIDPEEFKHQIINKKKQNKFNISSLFND